MSETIVAKLFKVVVVSLVALFTVCALALVLSGVATLFGHYIFGGGSAESSGISAIAGGVSISFVKLIVVAVIVLIVGLFGLTRIRRFLR